MWDKYQATEMLRSEEALWCAPNSTALASEKTQREALRPCATRDYSSTYSEEGGQNDQLHWQCAQLAATHSDVGRTGAVAREDSKPAMAVTSLNLSPKIH